MCVVEGGWVLDGVAQLGLGTISLLGLSASCELWEGTPETFSNVFSLHFLGPGRERKGHSPTHIMQRGWAKGLGEVQEVGAPAGREEKERTTSLSPRRQKI